MSYDTWLEKPYQDRAAQDDAFVNWCEENDLDPETTDFEDFEEYMENAAEDAAMERAELAWEDRFIDDY